MHGNDVRHVVYCCAICGRQLAFNVFSFVPLTTILVQCTSIRIAGEFQCNLLDGLALREGLWGPREEC